MCAVVSEGRAHGSSCACRAVVWCGGRVGEEGGVVARSPPQEHALSAQPPLGSRRRCSDWAGQVDEGTALPSGPAALYGAHLVCE
jgi:hypothetical protein